MNEVCEIGSPTYAPRERLIRLVRQLLGQPSRAVAIDARLSELGLNSLKMVNLMLAIEGEFDVVIPQDDITPENFQSIASLERMIERLYTPSPPLRSALR